MPHLVEPQQKRPRGRPPHQPVDGLKHADASIDAAALSYTIAAARRATGLSESALRRFEKAGRLKFIRIYGRVLICGDSLRALIRNDAADKAG